MLTITGIYAALLALLFLRLSAKTISMRQKLKVSMGDGGDKELLRCQRVHGNFAEYVPFALLLTAMAELQGTAPLIIHLLGGTLVLARLSHSYGLYTDMSRMKFRVAGMIGTFAVLFTGALLLLFNSGTALMAGY